MGICGNYAKKFTEANMASCVNIHLDARYPHVFFDVIKVEGKIVFLKSHGDGTQFEFPIKKGKDYEFTKITQQCPLGAAMGCKPATFKIVPFKGERI
jgi:hypothetical protein